MTEVAEVLGRMTGTTLRDYGTAGGMKTLSVRSMGATHTGVIFDGLMVGDAESGQVDLSRFALDALSEVALSVGDNLDMLTPARHLTQGAVVEVNGQRSTINGQLLETSKSSHQTVNAQLRLKAGSFGLFEPDVRVDWSLSRYWQMGVHGHFLRADNQYPFLLQNGDATTTVNRQNNAILSGSAEVDVWRHSDDARHEVHIKAGYYGADKQLPGQVVVYNPYNDETQQVGDYYLQGVYKTHFGHGLRLEAHAKEDFNDLLYRDPGTEYVGGVRENRYRQTEAYAGATLGWTWHPRWTVSVGDDFVLQRVGIRGSQTALGATCEDPGRFAFIQQVSLKWHTDYWTARATALWQMYRNWCSQGTAARDAQRLSPSLSLTWHPQQWLNVHASYKDHLRMPSFADNYYTLMGNRDLKPEVGRGATLGVTLGNRKHSGDSISAGRVSGHLTLDAFMQWVDDKIVAMPMNMMFWNMVNLGKVQVRGIEARLGGDLPFHVGQKTWQVSLDANYTLQDARNRTDASSPYYGQQIAYTPLHSGGASVALMTPWVNLSIHGTAMSERWSTNEHLSQTHMPAFYEMGLTAWHDFRLQLRRHPLVLTLRGDLKNLTDQQYEIVHGYPMPGRSGLLSLTVRY